MKTNILKKTLLLIAVVFVGYFVNAKTVFADDYPLTCSLNQYEVSYINDDGSFKSVGCYNSLSEARNKMKENADYVVRNSHSLSPTKIIDMNSGYVYSFPGRKNSATLSIYNGLTAGYDGTGAKTYTDKHKPLKYISNAYYDEKPGYSRGWIKVSCRGFEGYTDLEGVDFVPSKYLRNGIAITLGGNDSYGHIAAFKVICKTNSYKVERSGNYNDLIFTTYLGYSGNGGVGDTYSYRIGVAPSFMTPGTTYYSNNGVNFYTDIEEKNFVGTYYNYYQFLPFRTKTKISASTLDAYVSSHTSEGKLLGLGNALKNLESKYGCNAALVLGMGIHESGWGKSGFAMNRNNLFGLSAYDHDPGKATYFDSPEDCVAFLMSDFLANYMDVNCGSYFSMSLGTKEGGFITKYASDMYWGEKISTYYYQLDKFANGNNGNLTDYNAYSLALVNAYDTCVYREANTNQLLYKTANKNGYQKNLIVVNLGTNGNYTKTQLSNPIDGSGNVVFPITLAKGTRVEYDYNRSVGYITSSALVPLNYTNVQPETPKEKEPNPSKMAALVSIDNLTLEGNTIAVKGVGTIIYSHMKDLSKIKHELVIKNLLTDNEATFELTSEEYPGFGLNDGYDYKYSGFSGSADLTQVINGSFKLMIRITNGDYVKEKDICSNDFTYHNMVSTVGNYTNRITSNRRYGYRLELEISESPLDYSLINIVDNRASFFSFDNFTIDENLDLHIDGQALIYFTNYDNQDNVTYKVYLIKDASDYKELNTQNKTCTIDYNQFFNSKYDYSNICFETDDNIADLGDGEYKMIMEINKVEGDKTYVDYIEMTNLGDAILPNVTKDSKMYEVIEQIIRERMIVKVGTINEEE